jgi:hypothetical protein
MTTRATESRESGTVTVRVDRATHARMVEVAEAEGCSLTEMVARAVDLYWREWVFEQGNAAYAALRADAVANAEWEAEMALWDSTLMDGLEDAPPYHLDGETKQDKENA